MAFPKLFFPFVPRDFYEPNYSSLELFNLLGDCPVIHLNRQSSDNAGRNVDLSRNPNNFQVLLNVKHFKPEELSVKIVDKYVVIHGKHEETADQHGFVSREFTRRYSIPEGFEPEKVQSSLSQDGVLTIQAPMKCLEPPPKNERLVTIIIQQTASAEQQQKAQEQLQQQQQQQQQMQVDDQGDAK